MLRWQPDARYVEVYLNGDYIGVYQLIERIKRGKDRVDINKLDKDDTSGDALTGVDTGYAEFNGHGLDALEIATLVRDFPGLRRQPERYQHDRKSSWYLHDADEDRLSELRGKLGGNGFKVKIVYSSNRDLDILPANADKGNALVWLCRKLDIGLEEVVVAGDTGNDADMFALQGVRGIIPANGFDELRRRIAADGLVYQASLREADGVVEGLRHWLANGPVD